MAAVSTRPPSKYWLRYIFLPERTDPARVLSDEELAVVLDGSPDGKLPGPPGPDSPQP